MSMSTVPAVRAICTMWAVPPFASPIVLPSQTAMSDTFGTPALRANCSTQRLPRSHSSVPVPCNHLGRPGASLSCRHSLAVPDERETARAPAVEILEGFRRIAVHRRRQANRALDAKIAAELMANDVRPRRAGSEDADAARPLIEPRKRLAQLLFHGRHAAFGEPSLTASRLVDAVTCDDHNRRRSAGRGRVGGPADKVGDDRLRKRLLDPQAGEEFQLAPWRRLRTRATQGRHPCMRAAPAFPCLPSGRAGPRPRRRPSAGGQLLLCRLHGHLDRALHLVER